MNEQTPFPTLCVTDFQDVLELLHNPFPGHEVPSDIDAPELRTRRELELEQLVFDTVWYPAARGNGMTCSLLDGYERLVAVQQGHMRAPRGGRVQLREHVVRTYAEALQMYRRRYSQNTRASAQLETLSQGLSGPVSLTSRQDEVRKWSDEDFAQRFVGFSSPKPVHAVPFVQKQPELPMRKVRSAQKKARVSTRQVPSLQALAEAAKAYCDFQGLAVQACNEALSELEMMNLGYSQESLGMVAAYLTLLAVEPDRAAARRFIFLMNQPSFDVVKNEDMHVEDAREFHLEQRSYNQTHAEQDIVRIRDRMLGAFTAYRVTRMGQAVPENVLKMTLASYKGHALRRMAAA